MVEDTLESYSFIKLGIPPRNFLGYFPWIISYRVLVND